MDFQTLLLDFLGQNAFLIILAVFIIVCIFAGVRIVPQSEQFVVGAFRQVAGCTEPGHQLHRTFSGPRGPQGIDP